MSAPIEGTGDEAIEEEGLFFEEDAGEQLSADLGGSGEGSNDKGDQESQEATIVDPEIDLLAGEETAEGDEEESAGEGKEEAGEGKKGDFRDHPRFQQLHKQAKEAVRDLQVEKEAHATTSKQLEEYEATLEAWEELFGDYEDPVESARGLIEFANTLDRLAQRDQQYAQLVQEALGELEQGNRTTSRFGRTGARARDRQEDNGGRSRRATRGREENTVDEGRDSKAHRDRMERAEDTLDAILKENGVARKDANALKRVALELVNDETKITRAGLVELVKQAAGELDWDLKEVIRRKPTKRNPPVGSPGGAAMRVARKSKEAAVAEEKGGGDKAPETPEQGAEKRRGLFDGFLRDVVRQTPG